MSSQPAEMIDYYPATQISYECDGCVIAIWKNVSIGIWGISATLPLMLELEKVRELISSEYSNTSSIHVLVNDAGLPHPDARKKLEAVTAKSEGRLIGVATVLTGAGFRVSAMRGFLTGLHWLQHRPYEARVCGSVSEGAHWLAPLHSAHSVSTDAASLERLLERLCMRPSVVSASGSAEAGGVIQR